MHSLLYPHAHDNTQISQILHSSMCEKMFTTIALSFSLLHEHIDMKLTDYVHQDQ